MSTGPASSSASEDRRTPRSRAKADRRKAILDAAAVLFANSGYNGVSIEDLGAAVGVSGPAVYRHFAGKQAVLGSLLIGVSENLAGGGRAVVEAHVEAADALAALIGFHVEFALANPAVIRVQDRDFPSLSTEDQHAVRALQRGYVELWVRVLRDRAHASDEVDDAAFRVQAHAVFGLINSTPHFARSAERTPETALVRATLVEMAGRALAD